MSEFNVANNFDDCVNAWERVPAEVQRTIARCPIAQIVEIVPSKEPSVPYAGEVPVEVVRSAGPEVSVPFDNRFQ